MENNFFTTSFFRNSDFLDGFDRNIQNIGQWNYLASRFDNYLANETEDVLPQIPRTIHQIWLGGKMPARFKTWGQSWKEKNPDFEYILWTKKKLFVIFTAEQKMQFCSYTNFGPKSDFARYIILEKFGGIYCDTDCECVKSFSPLTASCSFFAGLVFDNKPEIGNSIIACIPHHPYLVNVLKKIYSAPLKSNNIVDVLDSTGSYFLTRVFFESKDVLQQTDVIFPSHFFYPFPWFIRGKKVDYSTEKQHCVKPCCYSIHWWENSWNWEKINIILVRFLKKIVKKIIFYDYWRKNIKSL